jgi:uncharacterized protein (DUF2267 family)/mannose-6-phosphate isomerase-like protein (cupin superfamily)
MVVGVLHAFRRRLSIKDAARFANALPPVLRALFVADWNVDEPQKPFEDVATMTQEVKALLAAHNFSPDTAIHDVAAALRRNINEADFRLSCKTMPAPDIDAIPSKKRSEAKKRFALVDHPVELIWAALRRPQFSLAPGVVTAKHIHPKTDEIQYIIEGSGAMWLGGERKEVKPGTLIIIPKGTAHGGTLVTSGPVKAIAIKIPPQAKDDVTFAN